MPHSFRFGSRFRPLFALLYAALLVGAAALGLPTAAGADEPLTLDTQVLVPSLPAPSAEDTDAAGPSVATLPAAPLEPPPRQPVAVMLDWYPGPQHAALLLAQHKGLFARQGLEVDIATPADPALPTRLLAAGRIDIAVTRQPLLHLQVANGRPLVRVGTLAPLPLSGLLLRDDAEASLAGTRIGYSTAESRELLLPALLARQDVALEALELVDVNFNAATQMVEQALDGVVTAQRLTLPQQLAEQGIRAQLIRFEDHGVPAYEGLVLVANRDRLSGQRRYLRRFMTALEEASAWMVEAPDEAWSRLADAEPALDTPANRDAWMAVLLRLSARPAALDMERYRRFDAFLLDQGLIEASTPLHHLAVDLGAP